MNQSNKISIKQSVIICLTMFLCSFTTQDSLKIVSTNGTFSEILCALGLEKNIVGVDVTSTFPASLAQKQSIGHNRSISSEGIIALKPTALFGFKTDLKSQLIEQITAANIKSHVFNQELSIEGTKKLINEVGKLYNLKSKAEAINKQIDADLKLLIKPKTKKKVLFIYARGAGTLMVAGKGTSVQKMIELAGGINAVNEFNDFKPLTAEALLVANPDVILMFDSGLQSLGGINGLLKIQGIAETNAGKNKKVIEMDGQLLTGFGPRVGKAVVELANKLK